jgi:predicted deacetylase
MKGTLMQRLPRPARYLLRIDDLSPTVNRERWSSIRDLVREFRIHPILGVIPDNQDDHLKAAPPDPGFWEEMREMQGEGATIALHGYRHRCSMRASSLVPLHRKSEFAGRSFGEQCRRIHAGLALLREEGLSPRLFIAPNHSFDRITLRALRTEGLPYLSDGFARVPFLRDGVTWIPQQIWSPESHRKGLWTICIHPDSTGQRRMEDLKRFMGKHGGQFTSFGEVIEKFSPRKLSLRERVHERIALLRVMIHMRRERMRV